MTASAMAPGGAALKGNLICLAAMLTWAAGFPAVDPLLAEWGVLALIAGRMALGAPILLAAWWALEGGGALARANWSAGLSIGALGFGLGATLLLFAQALADPVTAALVASMSPLAGAVYEFVLDRRPVTTRMLAGISLSIMGGMIALGPKLGEAQVGVGALIGLASVFIFVWGTRASALRLKGESAIGRSATTTVGAAMFALAAFAVAAAAGMDSARIGGFGVSEAAGFLVWTLLAFVLSQTLWLWSAGAVGVMVASLQMNATPFYVMIVSMLWLGAEWSWSQAAGAAVVALGVIVAQTNLFARRGAVAA